MGDRLMGRARYELLVINAAGNTALCDPISAADAATQNVGYTSISLKPRYNTAGYGEATVAVKPDTLAALYTPDARVLARRTDKATGQVSIVMAGPIEEPEFTYDVARDAKGAGQATIRWTDDKVWLAYSTVYPNPALTATAQTGNRYALAAVNPETAAYALVNASIGPGALAARRKAGLTMAAPAGLWPGVTVTTTWTRDVVLFDALRDISRLAGGAGLGYTIVQTTQGGLPVLQFQVFKPTNRAGSIIFSRSMGNISKLTYRQSAPTATTAIVGDATAGIGKIVKERTNGTATAAGWARRETWVDGSSAANAAELEQAGDTALADGGPSTTFTCEVIETPQTRLFYDLFIGDQVSAQPWPGGPFLTATVLGADITYTAAAGEKTTPVIGLGVDSDVVDDAKATAIKKLWRAYGRLSAAV
jgi:hypothetical protein